MSRLGYLLLFTLTSYPSDRITPRVCADPNNLPFFNRAGEGFENEIVQLLAKDLGMKLTYDWHAQRRGFIRNTLKARRCDVIPGISKQVDMVATTQPYYRSAYAFVTRVDSGLSLHSFDDVRLRTLRIGVQIVGDDYANTPPAHALARRGIVNVQGFRVVGDYLQPNPPARIIEALERKQIDTAIAWGPLAGYFAGQSKLPLRVDLPGKQSDGNLPLAFDIAMGMRHDDDVFRARIEAALQRNRQEIRNILTKFRVPLVEQP